MKRLILNWLILWFNWQPGTNPPNFEASWLENCDWLFDGFGWKSLWHSAYAIYNLSASSSFSSDEDDDDDDDENLLHLLRLQKQGLMVNDHINTFNLRTSDFTWKRWLQTCRIRITALFKMHTVACCFCNHFASAQRLSTQFALCPSR